MKTGLSAVVICMALISGKTYAQKQYSLLVRVPDTYTTEQAKSAGPLWDKLLEKWKADGVYVLSFAFPGESYTVTGNEKAVKKETVLSGNLKVVSNIVLRAAGMEQALAFAKSCPVLLYGGKVEVREIPKPVLSNSTFYETRKPD